MSRHRYSALLFVTFIAVLLPIFSSAQNSTSPAGKLYFLNRERINYEISSQNQLNRQSQSTTENSKNSLQTKCVNIPENIATKGINGISYDLKSQGSLMGSANDSIPTTVQWKLFSGYGCKTESPVIYETGPLLESYKRLASVPIPNFCQIAGMCEYSVEISEVISQEDRCAGSDVEAICNYFDDITKGGVMVAEAKKLPIQITIKEPSLSTDGPWILSWAFQSIIQGDFDLTWSLTGIIQTPDKSSPAVTWFKTSLSKSQTTYEMPRLDSSKPKGTKLFIWISAFGKDTPILGAAYLELTLSEPIKNPDLRDKKPPSQIAPQPTQPKGSNPKSNPPSSNPAPANPPSNSSSPLQPTPSPSPITTTQILTITTTTPTVTTITTIENNTPVVFTTSTMATVVLTSTSIGTVMPTGTPGISDSLEGSQNISPWKVTGINDSQGDREIGMAGDAAGRQNDPNREAGDEARGTLDNIKKKFGSGAKSLRWEIQSSGLTLGLVGLLVFW